MGWVDPRVCAPLGVWEEEWGTLCCRGDEDEGQAGTGVRWEEVGGSQERSNLSQRVRACRGREHKTSTDRSK